MVGLIDIGELRDTVELRGKKVEVRGVSVAVITQLLADSTELRMIFSHREVSADLVANLISFAPLAVARFIAAGVGKPEDDATVEFALRELTAGETSLIIEKLLPLTFPQGVKSFVEGLTALAPESVKRGWDQATKSQPVSPSALGMDIEQETSGNIPPGGSSASAS